MITAAEAAHITEETISQTHAYALSGRVERWIKDEAAKGNYSLNLDNSNLTPAERSFVRKTAKEHGFQVSDVGLVIYW